MKPMHRYRRESERGSVLVLTALIMIVLLGFSALVLDVGLLYITRRHLQNAADAAALAGGMQLPDDVSGAIDNARSFISQNDAVATDQTSVQVTSVFNPNDGIQVTIQRRETLFLGVALGQSEQAVGGRATALVTRVRPYDIWPWGLPQDYLDKGGNVTLKVGARQNKIGNFMALDFPGGSGADSYEEFIRSGYHGWVPNVPPGTWDVSTETGNIAGPTLTAVNDLMNMSSPYPLTDIRHPRVGIVPILSAKSWNEVQGKSTVVVVEFAAFLLTGVQGGATGQTQVHGRFLNYVYGIGESYYVGGPLGGLIGVRLWE
ncbi:MAG: hypothetical protein HY331_03630 [Chloroflexi bacterium]|nr:hypothetical protein [Chloroflexota bacterium]